MVCIYDRPANSFYFMILTIEYFGIMEKRKTGSYAEQENYEKPESEVIELDCEWIICSSPGVGGRVSDPEMGEEANWPGFINDRGF